MEELWKTGEPEKDGYYLVAWKNRLGQVIVSELWFNPDAIYHWWFSRGYTGQLRAYAAYRDAMKNEIVGWMPMPDPPKEN